MPQRIRAAVLNSAPGDLDVQELTLHDPGIGEVLVRVEYAGLCHSDLHEMDGTFPPPRRSCSATKRRASWKPSAPMSRTSRPKITW